MRRVRCKHWIELAPCCRCGPLRHAPPSPVKALIDTDVLLDVALAREPHVQHSAAVLRWAEAGGKAAVAWHTLTN